MGDANPGCGSRAPGTDPRPRHPSPKQQTFRQTLQSNPAGHGWAWNRLEARLGRPEFQSRKLRPGGVSDWPGQGDRRGRQVAWELLVPTAAGPGGRAGGAGGRWGPPTRSQPRRGLGAQVLGFILSSGADAPRAPDAGRPRHHPHRVHARSRARGVSPTPPPCEPAALSLGNPPRGHPPRAPRHPTQKRVPEMERGSRAPWAEVGWGLQARSWGAAPRGVREEASPHRGP